MQRKMFLGANNLQSWIYTNMSLYLYTWQKYLPESVAAVFCKMYNNMIKEEEILISLYQITISGLYGIYKALYDVYVFSSFVYLNVYCYGQT